MIREPAVYFARTIHVAADRLDDYLRVSERELLPVWRDLEREGSLTSIDTIRLTRPLHVDEGIPEWSVVHVGRVPDGHDAGHFFARESEALSERGSQDNQELGSVMRIETLRTTPKSHHPDPRPDLAARRGDVRLSVEVIDVRPEALEEYQRLMMVNAGPAARRLCDAGILYSFVPLESRVEAAVSGRGSATRTWRRRGEIGRSKAKGAP